MVKSLSKEETGAEGGRYRSDTQCLTSQGELIDKARNSSSEPVRALSTPAYAVTGS